MIEGRDPPEGLSLSPTLGTALSTTVQRVSLDVDASEPEDVCVETRSPARPAIIWGR
jgi:hypothetical protein